MRARELAACVVVVVAVAVGCGRGREASEQRAAPPPREPPAQAEPSVTPSPPASRKSAEDAIAWLSEQLREPAGDPKSPWALAHGLLAFGRDFTATDGRSAIAVAASFAEPRGEAGHVRYRFTAERDGEPVEPHPYLILKTLVELGAEDAKLVASDGKTLTVAHLRRDMLDAEPAPVSDADWHQYAWRLDVTVRYLAKLAPEASERAQLAPALDAALTRLEADDGVIPDAPGENAFAADQPMGAAKRNKSAIYGHPCGGMHFIQAVLRGVVLAGNEAQRARAARQARLLVARFSAERALYASTLQSHPGAALLVVAQQLKFFGHLLETLAVAAPLLGDAAQAPRAQASTDLLAAIAELRRLGAYGQLATLRAQNPQLRLDLVGDGCHAIHGLRETLDVLR